MCVFLLVMTGQVCKLQKDVISTIQGVDLYLELFAI